jgi:hypothetical protein
MHNDAQGRRCETGLMTMYTARKTLKLMLIRMSPRALSWRKCAAYLLLSIDIMHPRLCSLCVYIHFKYESDNCPQAPVSTCSISSRKTKKTISSSCSAGPFLLSSRFGRRHAFSTRSSSTHCAQACVASQSTVPSDHFVWCCGCSFLGSSFVKSRHASMEDLLCACN